MKVTIKKPKEKEGFDHPFFDQTRDGVKRDTGHVSKKEKEEEKKKAK